MMPVTSCFSDTPPNWSYILPWNLLPQQRSKQKCSQVYLLLFLTAMFLVPLTRGDDCNPEASSASKICLKEPGFREELKDGLTRFGAMDQFCLVMDISSSESSPSYQGVTTEYAKDFLGDLVTNRLWPFQAKYNLLRSTDSWETEGGGGASSLPLNGTTNPWKVTASSINFRGSILKNWLTFRIHSTLSPWDPKNSTGRIKGLVIVVKDQDGWPIGDFSQQLPCYASCHGFGQVFSDSEHAGDIYVGRDHNAIPCAYTPFRATSHPGMFIFHTNVTDDADKSNKTAAPMEVHTTWRFSQSACNFVTEIHIQAIVLEDVVSLYKGNAGESPHIKYSHRMGWAPVYNILYPTKDSLGSWDYVNKMYHRREALERHHAHFCHVPIRSSHGFIIGNVPNNFQDVGSNYKFMLSLGGVFSGGSKQYYGAHKFLMSPVCRDPKLRLGKPLSPNPAEVALSVLKALPEAKEFVTSSTGIRCPCPAREMVKGNYLLREPSRIEARYLHASHSLIAWTFLVPLAIFGTRFFKEVWVRIFCCEQYWWFMWHVLLLCVAIIFIMGSVFALEYRKFYSFLDDSAYIRVHIILGCISIVLFWAQLFLGIFRVDNQKRRNIIMWIHVISGYLNLVIAFILMVMMGYHPETGMTCTLVTLVIAWFIYFLVVMILMEVHIRYVDRVLMTLTVPRTYFPSPTKRLYTHDAPHSKHKMAMLGLFLGGLILFNSLFIYHMWGSKSDSCIEEMYGRKRPP